MPIQRLNNRRFPGGEIRRFGNRVGTVDENNRFIDLGDRANSGFENRSFNQSQGEQTFTQPRVDSREPTVGEALQGRSFNFNLPENPLLGIGDSLRAQATQNIDEADIRRRTLGRFRDQIAATNQIYDETLAQARQVGRGNVGRGTAALAARGLAGSQRGQAIEQGIEGENLAKERAIAAERAQAVFNINQFAEQQAQNLIEGKQAAKQQGLSSYVNFLEQEQSILADQQDQVINALLSQGIDPSQLNPDELNKIAGQVRTTGDVLRSKYDTIRAQQEASQAAADRQRLLEDREFGLKEDKFAFDKKKFGMEYALKQQAAAQRISSGSPSAKEIAQASAAQTDLLNLISSVKNQSSLLKGAKSKTPALPGSKRNDAKADLNRLVSGLTLENLDLMSGTLTDNDIAILENAATSLGAGLSEDKLIEELNRIEGTIVGAEIGNAGFNDASSGDLSAEQLAELQAEGLI